MKLSFKILFLLLTTGKLGAQEQNEQIALNYFVEKVLKEKYADHPKIWFDKKTTGLPSVGGPFFECFNDPHFKSLYRSQKKKDTTYTSIRINNKSITLLTKPKNKALFIKVHNAITAGGFSYIYIQVYLKSHFTDHYLFKIKEKVVIDYCLEPETI